jgi:hypothetical protein
MRYLHSLADNRTASAGSIFPLAGQWLWAEWIRRLSFESPLFGFGSLQRYPTEPATVSEGSRPPGYPASTFCDSFLRFSAPLLFAGG